MNHAATPAHTVLLVDDDHELCAMLETYLEAENFRVDSAHDGEAGVERLRDGSFDVVVMDITMPVLDGFQALREMRRFSDVPVLMLTARGDETDRIVGLELGADDYLPKPFNPRELSARLKAILRRARPPQDHGDAVLQAGAVRLDPAAQSLSVAGQTVRVTATEFAVLETLARSAGELVRKDVLSEEALGRRITPFDRSLDTHIANLRRKLGAGPDGEPLIRTVRGQGYLLVVRR